MAHPVSAPPKNKTTLILILGLMTALNPFSIDMYLPAFSLIAGDFQTSVATISLSLSSFFIGLSFGQILYGPILDRFGRKRPVFVALLIYVMASLGCLAAGSAEGLIAWRLVQALGGCATGVASMAMVRDLFDPRESAKVLSLLVLILGVSPLLAPTIGGYLASHFGWRTLFGVLAAMGSGLILLIRFFLPDTHRPDPEVSLRPFQVLKNFIGILKHPQFLVYGLTMATAFSGLFAYLAGSPAIFMGTFGVDEKTYGWIFAVIAAGFILSSQVNVQLLKRFTNTQILWTALACQVSIGIVFLSGALFNAFSLYGAIFMFFLYMSCFGFSNPNLTAMVMAPFPDRAGRASALLGFMQMGIGSMISMLVGVFDLKSLSALVSIVAGAGLCGFLILCLGHHRIHRRKKTS